MTPEELRAIRERYSVTVAPMVPVLAHGRADIFALLDEVERLTRERDALLQDIDASCQAASKVLDHEAGPALPFIQVLRELSRSMGRFKG